MTTYAPAPGRWISAAELARESGLREDLVQRFMPADTTGPVPMYNAGAVPLAKYVKRLTDMGTPASAIDAAVRELHNNTGAMVQLGITEPGAASRRGRTLVIAGAAAAAALVIGGVIGGLINIGSRDAAPAAAPVTITTEAPSADVRVPTSPDPVCAEWSPMNDSYQQKRQAWLKTDPNIASDQWSPEQRSLTAAVIPIMNAEAQDLIRLAGKAADPVLQYNLQMEAQYQKLFASRLPNYTPADQRLWQAANDFSNAVNSLCYAVAPR